MDENTSQTGISQNGLDKTEKQYYFLRTRKRKQRRANILQFGKFTLVGILNTLIYYSIYFLFIRLGYHFAWSVTAGTIASVINSYIWNKKYVFVGTRVSASEILKFCAVYLVQYLVNLLIIYIFVRLLHVSEELAGIAGVALSAMVSYVGLRYWGFRINTEKKDNENPDVPPAANEDTSAAITGDEK